MSLLRNCASPSHCGVEIRRGSVHLASFSLSYNSRHRKNCEDCLGASSMLAQRSIHLREGHSAFLVPQCDNVESKPASCSPPPRLWNTPLEARTRLWARSGGRICAVTVVCSQGILSKGGNSEEMQVRASDRGATQSCLDGADVRRAAPRDAGGGEPRVDAGGFEDVVVGDGVATVELRSPAPLSEGWPDSFSSSDYTDVSDRYLDSDVLDVGATGVDIFIDLPEVLSSPKKDVSCVENFVRAREAGKELVKRSKAGGSRSSVEDGVYYKPKVGDYVIGTVASGNYGKLDIDIGAEKLAHLFRKDVMPLEVCKVREMSWELPGTDSLDSNDIPGPTDGPRYVHDEEVLNLALEVTMPVERGTVFTMEVKGLTQAGIAVLSARSVARGYAWQRIRQLQEQDVTLEVQITEWTPAGLIAKIEGLRAFLPIYNLLKRPPESSTAGTVSYKEYVGQTLSVMIHSVDEKRSNLVISEKKAWVARNAYIGALVDGIVTDIQPYGVHLRIKDTDLSGVLHISNISRARIDDIGRIFSVGEELRVMVVPSNIKKRISFNTADLEIEDGLMLRDKEAVFQGAERIAAEISRAYKNINSECIIDSDDSIDIGEQEIVIANWDWLDFGDKANLD